MNLSKLCIKISLSLYFLGFGINVYSQTLNKVITETDSISSFIHGRRAYNYYIQKDYNNAIYEFDTTIMLDNRRPDGYHLRGRSLKSLKKYNLALLDFSMAIKINPKEWGYYIDRSDIYIKMADYECAKLDLETAKKIDSIKPVIFSYYGRIYNKTGNFTNAIENFNRAISFNKNEASYYWFKAEAYYNLQKDSLALINIERGISLDPNDIGSYYEWAIKITLRLKKYERLILYATKYLSIKPNECFTELSLVQAYVELRKYQDAITILDKIETYCRGEKSFFSIYYYRAQCNFVLNNFKKSGDDIEIGLKLLPLDSLNWNFKFYNLRMYLYLNNENFKEAKNDAKTILKKYPTDVESISVLGSIEFKQKNYKEAIKYLTKTINIMPENPEVYVERGFAEFFLKYYENSKKDFLKSLTMENNFLKEKSYEGLIEIYQLEKDFEKAFLYVNQAIDEFPTKSEFYLTRGKLFFISKENNAACADFKMAKQLGNAEATKLYKNGCK